ncbi:MAG: tetratricopeptide repeat protein [Planctomycetota bacterium]
MSALLICLLLGGDLVAAEKALADNKPEEAIELLGDLADADDADVRAQLVLGRAYLRLREYEAAVDPLLRAAERKPDDKQLMRDAAWACWGASANAGSFQQAYLEDALRYARKSDNAKLVADLLYELQRWEEALAAYDKVEETEANRLFLKTRAAYCLAALERADEARVAFGAALDEALRRNDLRAGYELAFRGKQQGRYMAALDKRIADKPEDVSLRLFRGYAREAARLWKVAVEDLRVVYKLAPAHADGRRRLARSLVMLGTKEQREEPLVEAERLARKELADFPGEPMSWATMRWIAGWRWANRDIPRAYGVLRDLQKMDPADREVVLNFGAMARRLGKYKEAEAAFLQYLEIDAEDPDILNDYGIVKDGMGRRAEAIALWEKVLSLEEGNLNSLENLFTKAWEDGDRAAIERYLKRGTEEAMRTNDEGLQRRWRWFRDRLAWAPSGFGHER